MHMYVPYFPQWLPPSCPFPQHWTHAENRYIHGHECQIEVHQIHAPRSKYNSVKKKRLILA